MAKRKKKKAAKRSRSAVGLIMFAFWAVIVKTGTTMLRLAIWLIIMAIRGGKKNPLAALGLCGFFLILAFVGMNALFQPAALMEQEKIARPLEKPYPPSQGKEDELAKIIRNAEQ